MEKTCEKCNKIFATKYTLRKHIESKICEENKESIYPCKSSRCEYKTISKSDLQKHLKTCKYIEIDEIVNQLQVRHQKEIDNLKLEYQKEIDNLKLEYQKEIDYLKLELDHQHEILRVKEECMKSEQTAFTSLLEKAITKPAVTNNTTNNNTNNNIRGNNNNLQSFLAPPDLYEKQVDPERIKAIDQALFEKHFWMGQKGMARFCVENIINTTDEEGNSKMLLCCTDPARKRFKYVGDDNHLSDDMEARHFIDKVSEPIVMVCRQVYDGVVKKIEDDKKETKDAFDLNFLENKTNVAQQKFLEINNIGDHNQNSDYKNEMTILLKK